MTSISAAAGSSYQSPLQKLQQELQAEITSGKISSGDQDALSSALDSIDTSMQADRASTSGGVRPAPGDMKSKIDDLIGAQVSSGKLTSDQADELKGVFEAVFADGPGGARGAGGPPPAGSPPSDSADDSNGTDGTTDISDIMQQFLDSLKQSLETSASSAYSASGATATGTTASFTALLVDYKS